MASFAFFLSVFLVILSLSARAAFVDRESDEVCIPPASPLTPLSVIDYQSTGYGRRLDFAITDDHEREGGIQTIDLAYTIVTQCSLGNADAWRRSESLISVVSRLAYSGPGFERPIVRFPPYRALHQNQTAILRRVYRAHSIEQRWYLYAELPIEQSSFAVNDYYFYGKLIHRLPTLPNPVEMNPSPLISLPSFKPRPLSSHWYLAHTLDPTVPHDNIMVHVSYSIVFRCSKNTWMESSRSSVYSVPFNSLISHHQHSRPAFAFPDPIKPNNSCELVAFRVYRQHPSKQTWHFYNIYPINAHDFFLDSWLNYGDASASLPLLSTVSSSHPSSFSSSCSLEASSIIPPPLETAGWQTNGHDPSVDPSDGKVYLSYSYIIECPNRAKAESRRSSDIVNDYNYKGAFYRKSQPSFRFPSVSINHTLLAYQVYRFHPETRQWIIYRLLERDTREFSVTEWNFSSSTTEARIASPPLLLMQLFFSLPRSSSMSSEDALRSNESFIRLAVTEVVCSALTLPKPCISILVTDVVVNDDIIKVNMAVENERMRDAIMEQINQPSSSLRRGLPLLISASVMDGLSGDIPNTFLNRHHHPFPTSSLFSSVVTIGIFLLLLILYKKK